MNAQDAVTAPEAGAVLHFAYGRHEKTGIRYVRFGQGPRTMAVIPGLSLSFVTDAGEALAELFADFTETYTVYLFDIREEVPEGYTIHDMGDDLACAMTELGLDRLFLFGCSMGGMEALYVAGAYPQLVEKVAVAATTYRANESSRRAIGKWIRLAEEGKARELTADMGQMLYSPAVFQAGRESFAAMAEGLTAPMLSRFARTARVMMPLDLTRETAAIRCPVLVLGSFGDRVMTAEASRDIAALTGGELYLYGEAYPHAFYDEAPDVRSRVKSFFDQPAAPRP